MGRYKAGADRPLRLTRMRAKLANAPAIMKGLDNNNKATESLPRDPEKISASEVLRMLPTPEPAVEPKRTRIILHTQRSGEDTISIQVQLPIPSIETEHPSAEQEPARLEGSPSSSNRYLLSPTDSPLGTPPKFSVPDYRQRSPDSPRERDCPSPRTVTTEHKTAESKRKTRKRKRDDEADAANDCDLLCFKKIKVEDESDN